MPKSPPPRRLKLYDMRHGNREPTPESESPSPYCPSPEFNLGADKYGTTKRSLESRYTFPEKVSQENPFPWGLPHANYYGAIKARPFIDEENAIILDPAPKVPRWRTEEVGWLYRLNEAEQDVGGDSAKGKKFQKNQKKVSKKKTNIKKNAKKVQPKSESKNSRRDPPSIGRILRGDWW